MTDQEVLEALHRIDQECGDKLLGEASIVPDCIKYVENLDLSYLQISKLPISIGRLVNLHNLNLRGTSITELPKSIGNLQNLQNLDLGETELDELPYSIGNLHNLQNLILRNSQISELPESLGNLKKLQCLDLKRTYIRKLPESIGNLENLQSLDLRRTQISELPDSIGNLKSLQSLWLSETKLCKLPESIENLKNLQNLGLHYIPLGELSESITKLESLQILELNGTRLKDIPDHIGRLSNLQTLVLSRNKFSELPDSIGKLENLRTLNLNYTELTILPDTIGKLSKLQALRICETQLCELPKSIGELRSLQFLELNDNRLSKLPGAIGNLKNLRSFDLSFSQIHEVPESIGNMKCLESLKISNTPLIKLPDSLGNLENLHSLDLRETLLNKLPNTIGNLRNLKSLDLCETPLNELPVSIGNLHALEELNVCGTSLREIPESIGNLTKLKSLKLGDLTLIELPKALLDLDLAYNYSESSFTDDNCIYMHGIRLKRQPVSLFLQPRELIIDYFNQPQIEINESKVVFLGSEGVGKTHTIKRILNNNQKITERILETPGISITSKDFITEGISYRINFWDFGGQEIMHSMHRCFLTDRTGYVVVVSTRFGDVTSQARFWLRNLRSFAKDAPALIFVNVWSNGTYYGIDESSLRHQFNNVVGVIHCSAKDSDDNEFSLITKSIKELALQNDSIGMRFPKTWENIRQSIITRGKKEYCIDSKAYIEICKQNGVRDASIQGWLLDWFNDLGECFTYSSGEEIVSKISHSMILNPKWLTNAVYIIIRELGDDASTGIVSHKKIKSILYKSKKGTLKGVSYSSDECEYVLEVMRKHMLSFKIPAKEDEFIPALLKSRENNETSGEWTDACRYELEYDYLPENILHNLMVEYYRLIDKDQCWRNQFVINIIGIDGIEAKARISADYEMCTLLIQIENNSMKDIHHLFQAIRDKILEINQKLDLKSRDFIIVQTKDENDEPEKISVRRMLKLLERDVKHYEAYEKRYDIEQLLGGAFSKAVVDKVRANIKNNDSIEILIATLGEHGAKKFLQEKIIELLSVDDVYEYVMSACMQIQGRKKFWNIPPNQIVSEDDRNDEMRDLISSRGLGVRDQSHVGQGGGGSNPGEVDLMVMKSTTDALTIIEAMNLTGVHTDIIKEHFEKLIKGYNVTGLRDLFLVSYVELDRSKFASFWKRYKEKVRNLGIEGINVSTDIDPYVNNTHAWIKSIKMTYDCFGEEIRVYHICARVAE